MPFSCKGKDGKIKTHLMTGNSLVCGHCDMAIPEGEMWLAMDEPYCCLVHQACLNSFTFDGERRTVKGDGRVKIRKALLDDEKTIVTFLNRPWCKHRVPKKVQDAMWRFFAPKHAEAMASAAV